MKTTNQNTISKSIDSEQREKPTSNPEQIGDQTLGFFGPEHLVGANNPKNLDRVKGIPERYSKFGEIIKIIESCLAHTYDTEAMETFFQSCLETTVSLYAVAGISRQESVRRLKHFRQSVGLSN